MVAIRHGGMMALSMWLVGRKGLLSRVGVLAFFVVGMIAVWSPLCFAVSNMSFPFVIFAYLVVALAGGLYVRQGKTGRPTC